MEDTNRKTALLVMDVQGATVAMLKENRGKLLDGIAKSVEAARNKKILIIYVVVGFRKGYPEVSSANKGFTTLKTGGRNFDTEEGMKVDARVAPHSNDIVVVKKRISAFAGSDLEVVLRANGIQRMVLTGIATSGVVLSTLREAADKDYQLTVLSDCCADADEEVHRVLTTKIFPRQADVVTHQQWIYSIQK